MRLADSLRQVLLAYSQKSVGGTRISDMPLEMAERLYKFDSCQQSDVPVSVPPHITAAIVEPIWVQTPQPAIGPPEAHLPRFRSEIGLFLGFQGGIRLGSSFGGFDSEEPASPRPSGSIDTYFNVGYGVEGATGLRSDGVFLLGTGIHADSQQFDGFCTGCNDARYIGASVPRVPGRFAFAFRARIPFWLVPGDLLLLAPIMSWSATKAYMQMAATAADGGLIPWQSVMITSIGDFQLVLGREIRVIMFGLSDGDVFLRRDATTGEYSPISFKSVQLDFPVMEYRPFRAFSETLTASAGIQLGFSYMWNYDEQMLGGGSAEGLGDSWLVYLRFLFDARVYP